MADLTHVPTGDLVAELIRRADTNQLNDEFAPYLTEQLRDPEVRAAYEAERDEVIQFGHPRWGL